MTPLVNWVKRSSLGFELEKSKSHINAEWIHESPRSWISAYIQGVTDGDGWVSSENAGISTNTYSNFYSEALKSLGIESKSYTDKVVINSTENLRAAFEIPLFKHATGRLDKLEELVKMKEVASSHSFVSSDERNFIIRMDKKGLSSSEIRWAIWQELQISRSQNAIKRVIGRENEQ